MRDWHSWHGVLCESKLRTARNATCPSTGLPPGADAICLSSLLLRLKRRRRYEVQALTTTATIPRRPHLGRAIRLRPLP